MKPAFEPCAKATGWAWFLQCLVVMHLVACGGGGGDHTADSLQSAVAQADSSIQVDALIEPTAPSASGFEVVVLESADAGRITSASINSTGQVAFTTFRAEVSHALFYDGQSIQYLGQGYTAAINDAGQVAGGMDTLLPHALRWDTPCRSANCAVDLGGPPGEGIRAQAINASGQIAGATTLSSPFLWTEGVGWLGLDTAPLPGFALLSPKYLNVWGHMAGNAFNPFVSRATPLHTFLWTPGRGVRDLGTLGGNTTSASGLNDAGQVAGLSHTDDAPLPRLNVPPRHAFLWSAASGLQDLGSLGGRNSAAAALNSLGQVAGLSDSVDVDDPANRTGPFADPLAHAFLWSPSGPSAGRMVDMGTLGTGLSSSAAALNDSGQVVGSATTDPAVPELLRAFVWTAAEGMVDLNTRIPHAPAGMTLTSAFAISQNGAILANSNAGIVLLTPASSDLRVMAHLSIISPPRAYKHDPELTRRARFSSEIRSEGMGEKPTGHTSFELLKADLCFESTRYDWLNVQGAHASYQGSGTLNGLGGYKFKVTLIDGGKNGPKGQGGKDNATDRMRIQIWHADVSQAVNVVDYDNQTDIRTEGTAQEGTASKTGNVLIHVRHAGIEQKRHAPALNG